MTVDPALPYSLASEIRDIRSRLLAIETKRISGGSTTAYLPLTGGTVSGDITFERHKGVNSLGLNTYATVQPTSNVYLYSPPNDRDAWIYLDSADTGSNWGIYHRQIDSTVGDVPANSIAFVGGGSSAANAYIQLTGGNFWTRGSVSVGGEIYMGNWIRLAAEKGLYSQSYGQHFYPDSGGFYWISDGPIKIVDGYEGTQQGYLGYHDSNGFGLLKGGSWWLNTPGSENHLIIGGYPRAAYATSGQRLMFGGGDTDAQSNYYIGTNHENYGGNYSKLDLRWHTGIRIGAQRGYGGVRFFRDEDLSTQIFSVGETDDNVRINQGWLYVYNNNGIYFPSHGGGIRMEDGTWIRSYNGRRYYSDTETAGYTIAAHGGLVIGGQYDKSAFNSTYARKHCIQIEVDTYWGGSHDSHTGGLIWCGNMNSGAWGTAEMGFRTSNYWGSYHSANPFRMKGTRGYLNLGVETTLNVHTDGAGRLGYYSSRRELKNLVEYIQPETSISRILQLQPIDFTWKKESRPADDDTELIEFDIHRGFFAEDAAEVDRVYGTWGWLYREEDGDDIENFEGEPLTESLLRTDQNLGHATVVSYDEKAIIADLVGSVKFLHERINELETALGTS